MGTQHLDETERFRIRTLYFDGSFPKSEIVKRTGYTLGQVKRAIRIAIPKPRSGRPTALSPEQENILEEFLRPLGKNRRMTYLQLSTELFDGRFSETTIRSTLSRLGYTRFKGLTQASFPRPPEKPSRSRSRVPANTGANAQAAAVTAEGEARPDADSHPVVGFHPGADSQDAN